MLEVVAEHLGEQLRDDLVFVGGAVAGLLITDPAMPAIRPTEDVDLIFQALARADFHRLERTLETRGFSHDTSPQAPICRWRVGSIAVDVMPTLDDILGFSNRWYPLALQVADAVSLPSGRSIRLLSTPSFLAALPGHLPGDAASQERAPELEDKLRQIANLN